MNSDIERRQTLLSIENRSDAPRTVRDRQLMAVRIILLVVAGDEFVSVVLA